MMTGFVARPTEYGPDQVYDTKDAEGWDAAADGIDGLAAHFGA